MYATNRVLPTIFSVVMLTCMLLCAWCLHPMSRTIHHMLGRVLYSVSMITIRFHSKTLQEAHTNNAFSLKLWLCGLSNERQNRETWSCNYIKHAITFLASIWWYFDRNQIPKNNGGDVVYTNTLEQHVLLTRSVHVVRIANARVFRSNNHAATRVSNFIGSECLTELLF